MRKGSPEGLRMAFMREIAAPVLLAPWSAVPLAESSAGSRVCWALIASIAQLWKFLAELIGSVEPSGKP